ncbi:hypothetical protein C5E45_29290 [Nocardia nova]|uniref:Uncharacterized protein n=1 Tax=Nocardia nova TaxID=37330 RepID=A0A2S6AHP5_9NOCA|nr:hypothetical protein C5E41_25420 [Nocardia nova]PPJ34742.1 hypothetical protein C5E45_29290 [Nocardia nova]
MIEQRQIIRSNVPACRTCRQPYGDDSWSIGFFRIGHSHARVDGGKMGYQMRPLPIYLLTHSDLHDDVGFLR